MADIGTVTIKFASDVSAAQTGIASMTQSVENFQNAAQTATVGTKSFYEGVAQAGEFATGSERGVRRMEFALASLTSQLTGINPMLARFSEGALLFSEGSATLFAVVGGVVAIAGAFALLGRDAAIAQKQTEDLEKELERLGPHAKMIAEQLRIDTIQGKITDLQEEANRQRQAGLGGVADALEMQITQLQSELATHGTRQAEAAREFNKLLDERSNKLFEQNAAMEEFVTRTSRAVELMGQEAVNAKGLEETLQRIFQDEEAQRQGPVAQAVLGSQRGAAVLFGSEDMRRIDEGVSRAVDEANRTLDAMSHKSEEEAKRWGQRITSALVEGISGRLQDLGDLMKAILEAWINKYIMTPFLKSLGILSPSTFGQYVGEMLMQGVNVGFNRASLGPMSLSLSVNTSGMPPARTVFDLARDRDWLTVLRESQLVNQSQGFRLRGQ